jgi:hypothetical protein
MLGEGRRAVKQRSRRNTIDPTHVPRRCPICLHLIDLDHDEAKAMNDGVLPPEFQPEEFAMTVEVDAWNEWLLTGRDPDRTLPYPKPAPAGDVTDFDLIGPAPAK